MSDYLDIINDNTKKIINISYDLQSLANSFFETGNATMYKILIGYTQDLMKIQKSIDDAISQNINNQYNKSTECVANTIKACLNVVNLENNK